AVRLVRAFDQFGQNGKTVQHVVLRIEFDREFKFIIRSEIAGVLEIFDGVFDGSVDLARRAHQRVAAKRHRVLARFTKNLEKALAFLAGGEQPTVFNPKNAAGNATLFDQVQHLLIAHAGIETSLEIGPPQLDGVIACLLGRIECGCKRCRVDRPHMKSKAPALLRDTQSSPRYQPAYRRIYRPAFVSVRYMIPSVSTNTSQD